MRLVHDHDVALEIDAQRFAGGPVQEHVIGQSHHLDRRHGGAGAVVGARPLLLAQLHQLLDVPHLEQHVVAIELLRALFVPLALGEHDGLLGLPKHVFFLGHEGLLLLHVEASVVDRAHARQFLHFGVHAQVLARAQGHHSHAVCKLGSLDFAHELTQLGVRATTVIEL